MDKATELMLQYGAAGVLTGAILFATWHLLKRTASTGDSEVQWLRAQVDQQRQEFLKALESSEAAQRELFSDAGKAVQTAIETLCERLEQVADRMLHR